MQVSIHSLAPVGNTEIFEPPKKIEKQTQREGEREKVWCLLRMRKSSREKKTKKKKKKKRRRSSSKSKGNSPIVVDEKKWRE
jgi:hypothetical protein